MTFFESLFLGIIQGVTEFLPVSSDGHLQIGAALLGMTDPSQNLGFTVLVHVATVLAAIVVFRNEIGWLLKGLLKFSWNEETKYSFLLIISAVPVVIVGLFFMDNVEELFGANLKLTGFGLLGTAAVLFFTLLAPLGKKEVGLLPALIMGIAQALAVLPGLSRSGTTIASAMVMGIDKEKATRFSFLMVMIPILGQAALDVKDLVFPDHQAKMAPGTLEALGAMPLIVAFITSFVVGILACTLLLNIVRKNKIHYFGYYCVAMAVVCLLVGYGVITPPALKF